MERTAKIRNQTKEKIACIYLRQSTMGQVRYHQESTERQYALQNKAMELGWRKENIRILDGDLGISGTQINNREDFKALVADVSMKKVGRYLPWKLHDYPAPIPIGIDCWNYAL